MDLLGTYSSSDDDDDESLNDVANEAPTKVEMDLIPLPDFEIDATGKGNVHKQIDPKVKSEHN